MEGILRALGTGSRSVSGTVATPMIEVCPATADEMILTSLALFALRYWLTPRLFHAPLCPHLSAARGLRCEVRCYLCAEVSKRIRWFPDVDLSGMSGFYGHPRMVVESGVGSSKFPNAIGY